MSERATAKRIPKSIGTDAKLLGSYTLSDAAVALLPGVIVVLVTQVVLPPSLVIRGYPIQSLMLPIAAVSIGVGAVFVYVTPAYATSIEWLGAMVQFHRADHDVDHEDAKEVTQVERVHLDRNAIERQDGAFIGLVEVSPPSMALATDEEWDAKASAFQEFLNTSVTFPIQIYSTTQPFPVEQYLDRYRDRLSDDDVQANPTLERLIENYIAWYREDLDARQMTIRHHYVVVTVTPDEVQFDRDGMLDRLAGIPILGVFLRAIRAPPIEEQRAALTDTLDERLARVESGLREIDGCRAERLDAADGATVITEFWAGQQVEYGNMEQALQSSPLIGGAH